VVQVRADDHVVVAVLVDVTGVADAPPEAGVRLRAVQRHQHGARAPGEHAGIAAVPDRAAAVAERRAGDQVAIAVVVDVAERAQVPAELIAAGVAVRLPEKRARGARVDLDAARGRALDVRPGYADRE